MSKAEDILALWDALATIELKRIGDAIGYGNAQEILGRLWDEKLKAEYNIPPGRGRMGVTVKDKP